jgi:hypothetical protein
MINLLFGLSVLLTAVVTLPQLKQLALPVDEAYQMATD